MPKEDVAAGSDAAGAHETAAQLHGRSAAWYKRQAEFYRKKGREGLAQQMENEATSAVLRAADLHTEAILLTPLKIKK